MNTKTVYTLLETIELPVGTSVHMLNGKDYTINDNGELVRSDGYKLPISKKNIAGCEFSINEEKKNYNFRVYKDEKLIKSLIHYRLIKAEVQVILRDLYYHYREPLRDDLIVPISYGNNIEVIAEEIIQN